MNISLIIILLAGLALPVDFDFIHDETSTIKYTGHHMIHDWTGVTNDFNFVLNCMDEQCVADIIIELETFDSRNPNRDSNMLYYTEIWDFPHVRLKSSGFQMPENDTDMKINGELFFHGIKRDVALEILFTMGNDTITVRGGFQIQLSDYNIERPALLMLKIEDLIDIEFSIKGQLKEKK